MSNVLICSTLYFPGRSSNFETGTLLKTLKRRAELIAKCAFPSSVLATSSRNGQCLSESRWESRFCDVICAQRYFGQFFSAHFKFEKLPTCISRLPFALNETLNLSNTLMLSSFIASFCKYYLLNAIFFQQYVLTKICTTGYFLTNTCHIYYYYYYYYYYL